MKKILKQVVGIDVAQKELDGIKMKAAVAVQRKLLELIYSIYKTNTPYDKDYLKKLESSIAAP